MLPPYDSCYFFNSFTEGDPHELEYWLDYPEGANFNVALLKNEPEITSDDDECDALSSAAGLLTSSHTAVAGAAFDTYLNTKVTGPLRRRFARVTTQDYEDYTFFVRRVHGEGAFGYAEIQSSPPHHTTSHHTTPHHTTNQALLTFTCH